MAPRVVADAGDAVEGAHPLSPGRPRGGVNEREDLRLRAEQNRMALRVHAPPGIACSRSSVCSRLASPARRPHDTAAGSAFRGSSLLLPPPRQH